MMLHPLGKYRSSAFSLRSIVRLALLFYLPQFINALTPAGGGTCTGHQLPPRLCRLLGPDMVGERRVATGRFDDTVDYIRFV